MIRRPPRSTLFPTRRSSDLGGTRAGRRTGQVQQADARREGRLGAQIGIVGVEAVIQVRSEEHTSELQSQFHLVCRLLLEKKKNKKQKIIINQTKSPALQNNH